MLQLLIYVVKYTNFVGYYGTETSSSISNDTRKHTLYVRSF